MSREARYIISRLIEVDPRRRFRAKDLIKESWIKCSDLPLSVFESAGFLYRASSVDGRARVGSLSGSKPSSNADHFNKNITKLHINAMDHLKSLGYSSKAIEDSLHSKAVSPA